MLSDPSVLERSLVPPAALLLHLLYGLGLGAQSTPLCLVYLTYMIVVGIPIGISSKVELAGVLNSTPNILDRKREHCPTIALLLL